MNDNALELERLRGKIQRPILEFFRARRGTHFHAEELRNFVMAMGYPQCAPSSADRVLRYLRQRGFIDYTCINRRMSLYKIPLAGD